LYVEEPDKYQAAAVYDLAGRLLLQVNLTTDLGAINLDGIPQGMYILCLEGMVKHDQIKFIKE
jgi:hypothetical protein